MKATVFIACAAMLVLMTGFASAEEVKFNLVGYDRYDMPYSSPAFFKAVAENQVKPIADAFGWDINADQFSQPSQYPNKNSLTVRMNFSLPNDVIQRYDYSIWRDGSEITDYSGGIQVGDVLRLAPITKEISDHGNDWIVQGGNVDSPPIEMLSAEQFEKLKGELQAKFDSRYPLANSGGNYKLSPKVPVFEAESVPFNEYKAYYTADNGFRAYIVPLINRRKAGIQVFCTAKVSISPNDKFSTCKEKEGGAIECVVKTKTSNPFTPSVEYDLFCTHYVDKVIFDGKAVQADWLPTSESDYIGTTTIYTQVLPPGKSTPKADFDCKTRDDWGGFGQQTKVLECDASNSRDPDGTIQGYYWKSNNPRWWRTSVTGLIGKFPFYEEYYSIPSTLTVTLKVTDNEGFYDTKTKTFRFSPDGEIIKETELTAEYNKQTKMAEVTAKCETGKIDISINNAITGSSILEKQAIPCNQTTPIGPIKVKGAYKVSAASNPEITPAIFTIS